LQLQITELDVSLFAFNDRRTDMQSPEPELLEKQAEYYENIFQLFREYKEIITGVTFWGLADDKTWLDKFPVKNRKNWPLLFDVQHQPKEAFWKVVDFNKGG
jgi:endo-1,4-beta-xylanase